MDQATKTINHESNSGAAYDGWLDRIRERFLAIGNMPLFTTDIDPDKLWLVYLDSFSPSDRQFHNCGECRHFIKRFGGLVVIGDDGRTSSAIWDILDVPDKYGDGVVAMLTLIRKAKVTGIFLSSDKTWGAPVTGPWTHFAVNPHRDAIHRSKVLTAGQAMATKREDHTNVMRALAEFRPELIVQALALLNSDALYRSDKVIGPAQWLADLHGACKRASRTNVVWRAVATAPAGFYHPRSSMIGSLLEDLANGLDFATVSRRFKEKMSPLQYQRPQAAPSVGTIAQAEKLVEQLGIARSLERRFALLEELQTIWKPIEEPKKSGAGVFSHLQPKQNERQLFIPVMKVTWEKFARDVLPGTKSIEINAPSIGAYAAFVTAVHADAPPILQWDNEDRRNPVSWYLYPHGSSAGQFNLLPGWQHVTAIALNPERWNPGCEHFRQSAIFTIEGCRDMLNHELGLFPEDLKAELHCVRSVIEAHSRATKLAGLDQADACGLLVNANAPVHVRIHKDAGIVVEYDIDRWE
jgi:hypothetical protein